MNCGVNPPPPPPPLRPSTAVARRRRRRVQKRAPRPPPPVRTVVVGRVALLALLDARASNDFVDDAHERASGRDGGFRVARVDDLEGYLDAFGGLWRRRRPRRRYRYRSQPPRASSLRGRDETYAPRLIAIVAPRRHPAARERVPEDLPAARRRRRRRRRGRRRGRRAFHHHGERHAHLRLARARRARRVHERQRVHRANVPVVDVRRRGDARERGVVHARRRRRRRAGFRARARFFLPRARPRVAEDAVPRRQAHVSQHRLRRGLLVLILRRARFGGGRRLAAREAVDPRGLALDVARSRTAVRRRVDDARARRGRRRTLRDPGPRARRIVGGIPSGKERAHATRSRAAFAARAAARARAGARRRRRVRARSHRFHSLESLFVFAPTEKRRRGTVDSHAAAATGRYVWLRRRAYARCARSPARPPSWCDASRALVSSPPLPPRRAVLLTTRPSIV